MVLSEEINYEEEYQKYKELYEKLLADYEALKIKYYGSVKATEYHEAERSVKDKAEYNSWMLGIGLGDDY